MMMDTGFNDVYKTSYVALSELQAAARVLRTYLVENGNIEAIPLTASPIKFREGKQLIPDAYIISYEAFSAFQKLAPDVSVTDIQSLAAFHKKATQNMHDANHIFSDQECSAQIIIMTHRKGEIGTCFVVLSPAAGSLFNAIQPDPNSLFTPKVNGDLDQYLKGLGFGQSVEGFRKGKGTSVDRDSLIGKSKNDIQDRTDHGEIVWLSDKSIAAVSPEWGLKLKAFLFPNDSNVIQPISSEKIKSLIGVITEKARTSNAFYRVENHHNVDAPAQFMIIPDHVVRYLDIDAHGVINGIREPTSHAFSTVTPAWISTDFDTTKIFLTSHEERAESQLRFDMPDEQAALIRRMLGIKQTNETVIQGMSFEALSEHQLDKKTRPKGLIVPETIRLTAVFDREGRTKFLEIEGSKRPHLTELIIRQSQSLAIQSDGREYPLTPL